MTHTAMPEMLEMPEMPEMPEMINLADGIEARLSKSLAMLSVIRSTDTSTYNDQVMHEYLQTIQDLIEEAHSMHGQLWQQMVESQTENVA